MSAVAAAQKDKQCGAFTLPWSRSRTIRCRGTFPGLRGCCSRRERLKSGDISSEDDSDSDNSASDSDSDTDSDDGFGVSSRPTPIRDVRVRQMAMDVHTSLPMPKARKYDPSKHGARGPDGWLFDPDLDVFVTLVDQGEPWPLATFVFPNSLFSSSRDDSGGGKPNEDKLRWKIWGCDWN